MILETPDGVRTQIRDNLKWLWLDLEVKAGRGYYLIKDTRLEIIRYVGEK